MIPAVQPAKEKTTERIARTSSHDNIYEASVKIRNIISNSPSLYNVEEVLEELSLHEQMLVANRISLHKTTAEYAAWVHRGVETNTEDYFRIEQLRLIADLLSKTAAIRVKL